MPEQAVFNPAADITEEERLYLCTAEVVEAFEIGLSKDGRAFLVAGVIVEEISETENARAVSLVAEVLKGRTVKIEVLPDNPHRQDKMKKKMVTTTKRDYYGPSVTRSILELAINRGGHSLRKA